jgi:hypothetical protein
MKKNASRLRLKSFFFIDSDDEALLLKTAVAMIERRAIPKIGSFVDIVLRNSTC